jgi:hypothetical protein
VPVGHLHVLVVADRELPAHAVDCVFGTDHQEHLVEVVAFSYSLDGAPYTDPLGRSAAGHGGTYTDTFQFSFGTEGTVTVRTQVEAYELGPSLRWATATTSQDQQPDQPAMRRARRGRSMLAFRTVQQSNHCAREDFLYELKAGPAGGRLRRPSSAGSTTLATPSGRTHRRRG